MENLSKFEVLEAIVVNSCGMQVSKQLNEIFAKRCCACRLSEQNLDCAMLTQDEKVALYFEEALQDLKLTEVEKHMKVCISALLPNKRDQSKFWQRVPMDPRHDDTRKAKIKKTR